MFINLRLKVFLVLIMEYRNFIYHVISDLSVSFPFFPFFWFQQTCFYSYFYFYYYSYFDLNFHYYSDFHFYYHFYFYLFFFENHDLIKEIYYLVKIYSSLICFKHSIKNVLFSYDSIIRLLVLMAYWIFVYWGIIVFDYFCTLNLSTIIWIASK